MTGKAIDALAARNKGFFLMVEGGRIDHALHATNARARRTPWPSTIRSSSRWTRCARWIRI